MGLSRVLAAAGLASALLAAAASAAPPAAQAGIELPEADSPPPPTSDEFRRDPSWEKMPIDELRRRANDQELPAMEELARRLLQGVGVARDQQAGAGWLLRAARQGSAQAAFNVGVMYERGFVVERDPAKAVEWYRKAAAADLPMAEHNLALMLRDGRSAPRDGKAAIELLRAASRHGMAASMLALGDLYERGEAVPRDLAAAVAWFAVTVEFERQTHDAGSDTALGKAASQRLQALRPTASAAELDRARVIGNTEFKLIVETLNPAAATNEPAPGQTSLRLPGSRGPLDHTVQGLPTPALPPLPSTSGAPESTRERGVWPAMPEDQVRAVQRALAELKLLYGRPDGILGPVTRAAIRDFQKKAGLAETGEPSIELFAALQAALAGQPSPKAN